MANGLLHFISIPGILFALGIESLLLLLLLPATLWLIVRQQRWLRRWQRLVAEAERHDAEAVLVRHEQELRQVEAHVRQLRQEQEAQRRLLAHRLETPGVVRFNAFAETGSDLSYAVALLDENGNGVVLSSLFGREDSRTYAKPVENWQSRYHLTEEEKTAIAKAGKRQSMANS